MSDLNGDLAVRVAVDTEAMPWTPSPSRTVFRKRVHLVGPPEAGQVTSVVRYVPGSTFRAHAHPDGEEILVLEGVFSDEHGDWPRGTYLLNPEGFRHAPFSREGCILFVKLRQFPGRDRRHIAIATDALDWQPGQGDGIELKPLYAQAGFGDTMRLERWAAGTELAERRYPGGAELFVLAGEFEDDGAVVATAGDVATHGSGPDAVPGSRRGRRSAGGTTFGPGTWHRFPVGATHAPRTARGCMLYVKEGGLAYLNGGIGH